MAEDNVSLSSTSLLIEVSGTAMAQVLTGPKVV